MVTIGFIGTGNIGNPAAQTSDEDERRKTSQ